MNLLMRNGRSKSPRVTEFLASRAFESSDHLLLRNTSKKSYQVVNETDDRKKVHLDGDVELISAFDIDGHCSSQKGY
jgi:hypothetical protein